jgi:hypothetical protein
VVNVNCAVKIPVGVLSACQNGIYIGQDVQALACEKGWRYSEQFQMVMKDDDTEDAETYIWAWDEAEQFLNDKVAEENHYFGSQPMAGCGCWGYWEILDDDYGSN